jgi:hypothetical protein
MAKRTSIPKHDDQWFHMFYEQVGRELSLARESQRETHTWVLTLTAGLFTAFVTIGKDGFQYPTENLFLGVILVTPLMFRFFVRSCLEYQILHRWTELRNSLDAYFYAINDAPEHVEAALHHLQDIIPKYYFRWFASKSFGRMLLDNIKLAYGWPFLILLGLLLWGFALQTITPIIRAALWLFIPWMFLEIFWFFRYHGFKQAKPTDDFSIRKLATKNK